MNGNEITENNKISLDVQDVYAQFLNWEIDNNNKPYIINSKVDPSSYLFDKNHKIINKQDGLFWIDIWKEWEYLPFARYYNENWKKIYYKNKEINRNTPEGMFYVSWLSKLNPNHYDWTPIAVLLEPLDNTKYDTKKIVLWMHSKFKPKNNQTEYINALNTKTKDDNFKSKWCINVENIERIAENIYIGSVVYNTEFNKYTQLALQQNQEKIKKQSHRQAQNIYQKQQQERYKNNKLIAQNIK